jgi:dihydroorotase-like cyclic amidohydrolase
MDFTKITYEITPHHLLLSASDIKDKETIMKCSPPIRDARE